MPAGTYNYADYSEMNQIKEPNEPTPHWKDTARSPQLNLVKNNFHGRGSANV